MTNKWEADKSYIEWRYEQAKRARSIQLSKEWLDNLKSGQVRDYPTELIENGLAGYSEFLEEEKAKPYSDDVRVAMWFYSSVIEIYQKELNRRRQAIEPV